MSFDQRPDRFTHPMPSARSSKKHLAQGASIDPLLRPGTLPDQERKIHLTHLFKFIGPPLLRVGQFSVTINTLGEILTQVVYQDRPSFQNGNDRIHFT